MGRSLTIVPELRPEKLGDNDRRDLESSELRSCENGDLVAWVPEIMAPRFARPFRSPFCRFHFQRNLFSFISRISVDRELDKT